MKAALLFYNIFFGSITTIVYNLNPYDQAYLYMDLYVKYMYILFTASRQIYLPCQIRTLFKPIFDHITLENLQHVKPIVMGDTLNWQVSHIFSKDLLLYLYNRKVTLYLDSSWEDTK